MGVTHLMSTLLKHPATKDAIIENVPKFECLLVDYNANIHYILQKTITELNEILYFTYHNRRTQHDIVPIGSISMDSEYNLELQMTIEDIEDKIYQYNEAYQIGTCYTKIYQNLTGEERISDIIFMEIIKYTKVLIGNLNKGDIKKVFLSLDGVPSMAKIKEQRNRRYVGAYLNNIVTDIINKFKLKNANIYQIDIFCYRSAICTGTNFMEKIQQALFHLDMELDIEVSTINIKGEGEKKIIHALDEYDNYNNYCIMSPDSDMLILIGLLNTDGKFSNKQMYNFRIDYQHNNKYQFFDLNLLIENFRKYFSIKIKTEITKDKILDLFFMLVVFGNDFLPKLAPLDIVQHFDFVCETCLKISMSGLQFIKNNNLNYLYLLEFFKKINDNTTAMSLDNFLHNRYNNYYKLCNQISISNEDLDNTYHHPALKPININCFNFSFQMKILVDSYHRLIDFLKYNTVREEDIYILYKDIHRNLDDSYLMLVLPRLLRFPGSDKFCNITNKNFFTKFVHYINASNNFTDIKFRNKLMARDYRYMPQKQGTSTAYLNEMDKISKSMEPYRSIFRMSTIDLMECDIYTGDIIDLRDTYYETYVKNNISKQEIDQIVFEYLMGIEWLYQYYITGKHMEWSGWQYNQSQPPLISDIINYLKTNPNCQNIITVILSSCNENNMTPNEHYLYVTPNEYTNAGISPNLADVLHLIDGYGAPYLNKCQIKWHEL